MNAGLLIIILLLGLSFLGFPIYLALGIGALAALNLADLPLIVLPQRMFAGMNSSALLAIPFFILAGNIMSRSITGKLIDICNAIIGHIKGSLALVTILASALFGAISGSGVATASAIGGITIPAMKREGYPAPFAVGVASISSILGPIIPPSIVLIVYASITNVSVAELFLGSVLPGIILAVALIAYGLYYGHKHNLPAHEKPNLKKIGTSVRKGIWALLMPIIMLGGILSGIFTATEAAVVGVFYALVVGLFILKGITVKDVMDSLGTTAKTSADMYLLMSSGAIITWMMARAGIPGQLTQMLLGINDSPAFIFAVAILLILFLGMFMDNAVAMILVAPILAPIARTVGIHELQFGAVMVVALNIGLITPPFGMCLFASAQVSKVKFEKMIPYVWPFLFVSILVMILMACVPEICLLLPRLGGFI